MLACGRHRTLADDADSQRMLGDCRVPLTVVPCVLCGCRHCRDLVVGDDLPAPKCPARPPQARTQCSDRERRYWELNDSIQQGSQGLVLSFQALVVKLP